MVSESTCQLVYVSEGREASMALLPLDLMRIKYELLFSEKKVKFFGWGEAKGERNNNKQR